MPVRLIDGDERESVRFGEGPDATTFEVRRMNAGMIDDIVRRSTANGKHDADLYSRLLWSSIVLGWTNLLGSGGNVVTFPGASARDRDGEIVRVCRALPTRVRSRLETAAMGSYHDEVEALGNSVTSSAKP